MVVVAEICGNGQNSFCNNRNCQGTLLWLHEGCWTRMILFTRGRHVSRLLNKLPSQLHAVLCHLWRV